MQFKHAPGAVSASFDDENLVAAAGLVPVMRMAQAAGLSALAGGRLSVPGDKGANAGLKVASLVAGMAAGADSIQDMDLLRHGGMRRLFAAVYAPSTLGSFLRAFTFGHVRQLDAVASRVLANLAGMAPLLAAPAGGGHVMVDVDDTIVRVHGHAKQGAGFGYSGVRGLNALIAAATAPGCAPVILSQRLRRGSCNSSRGAARIVGDAIAALRRLPGMAGAPILFRADSAYYGHAAVSAALGAGAAVSVTARLDPAVRRAIAAIPEDGWEAIQYTDAVYDDQAGRWVSHAEVAETPFTAFASRKKAERVPGRLVVRRVPELNKKDLEHPTLFDTHRFHAFFTTSELGAVEADKTHRQHAVVEQVHSDLKAGALAHLPSGAFNANAAWLALAAIAFNLTRAAACASGKKLAKSATATIRRTLVAIPARITTSARRITLHLPARWPWQHDWEALAAATGPPAPPTT